MLAILLGGLAMPADALAYDFYEPDTLITDANGKVIDVCPGPGLTRRIIPCLKETLLDSTARILLPLTEQLSATIRLMMALAVALLGALMIGGKTTAPFKDTLILLLKLGGVSFFITEIYNIFVMLLDTMDSLLIVVTGYVMVGGPFQAKILNGCPDYGDFQNAPTLLIWDAVDCTLNALVGGILSPASLIGGLAGFCLSAMMTNTLGFMIGMMGIRLILQLIWAIIKAVYIYLGCYIAICLMMLMSPIFVPMILFSVTKSYFERWIKLLLNYILQPLLLFVYLAMLLVAFDVVIFSGPYSLYSVIAGEAAKNDNFTLPWDEGGEGGIGGWLLTHGAYSKDFANPAAIPVHHGRAAKRMSVVGGNRTMETGVGGTMTVGVTAPKSVAKSMLVDANTQRSVLARLGMGPTGKGKGELNFYEVNIPIIQIDWKMLADENGFDSTDEQSFLNYMIKVFMSFLMALITGYVFISLLDSLPFIGSGIAAAGDEKTFGLKGIESLQPPGSEAMDKLQGKLMGRFNDLHDNRSSALGGRR